MPISLLPAVAALLPSPKVYKLLYASRLADHGLPAQALQYCEHVCTALLRQEPAAHSVLARQVVRVSPGLLHPIQGVIPAQDLLGWEASSGFPVGGSGWQLRAACPGFAAKYSKANTSAGFLIPMDLG